MVNVTYTPYRLKVTGHALSAPKGHDLVCAGISTLVTTLGEMLAEKESWLDVCAINMTEGDADIYVVPKKGNEYKIKLICDTILTGIKLVYQSYPEYIQLNC